MFQMLEAALRYADLEWSPIPVAKDKTPAVVWKQFQERRATDEEMGSWFETGDLNLGIVTGAISGLVALDLDGPRGVESAKRLNLPKTPTSKTGRAEGGGYHVLFEHPGFPVSNRAGLFPGVDVRGDGGYIIVPPSVHASGIAYTWVRSPFDLPRAPIPENLLALLKQPAPSMPRVVTTQPDGEAPRLSATLPEGERNDGLFRYGRALVATGFRNLVEDALLRENAARCNPPLPEAEVRRLARHVLSLPDQPAFRGAAR